MIYMCTLGWRTTLAHAPLKVCQPLGGSGCRSGPSDVGRGTGLQHVVGTSALNNTALTSTGVVF